MSGTTIPDIARRAGVSPSTVDRTLNGRAGVRAANRQRVLKAAEELGYLPMEDARAMPARAAHLEFLIPHALNAFLLELISHVEDYARRLPLVASCAMRSVADLSPEALIEAVDRISLRTSGVGLIAVDHPRTRHVIRELDAAGIRVVTLATDVPGSPRSAYVGVDNRIAGRTAALAMGRMATGREGRVAILYGSAGLHGHDMRLSGFRAVLSEQFPALTALPAEETREDAGIAEAVTARLMRTAGDIVGIYCAGAARTGVADALRGWCAETDRPRPFVVMHDLTPDTRRYLAEDRIDVVIDQNARLMAEQSVLNLLGSIASARPYLTFKYIEPRIIMRENVPI